MIQKGGDRPSRMTNRDLSNPARIIPLVERALSLAIMYRRATFSTYRRLLKELPPVKVENVTASEKVIKKSHKFRNFLLATTLLAAGVYGGGAYVSMNDEKAYNMFTAYIPGASGIMYLVDEWRFRQPVYSRFGAENPTISVVPSKATPRLNKVEDKSSTVAKPVGVVKETSKNVVSAKRVEPTSAQKPTAEALPTFTIPEDLDPVLSPVVDFLSKVTTNINNGKVTEKDVRDLLESLQAASSEFSRVRVSHAEKLKTELAKQSETFKSTLDSQIAELQGFFGEEKKRLLKIYNDRLTAEVDAAKKAILAEANTAIMAQYVEQQEEFAKTVAKRVEKEREGRLAKLETLASELSAMEKTVLSSGAAITESDGAVNFFVALSALQTAMATEAKPIHPQLMAVAKSLPEDPLVKAVVASVPEEVQAHGVLSPAQLAARFALIAPEIRRASLAPADAGVFGHLTSRVLSGLLVKKHGMPQGDDVESILARTETLLSQGNVVDAVAEVNSLQGWPKRIAADWLSEGRKRGELEFLVKVLSDEGRLWSISTK